MSLQIHHSHKITYQTELGLYTILGQLNLDLSSMRVTLHVLFTGNPKKYRVKLDLYDLDQVIKWVEQLAEQTKLSAGEIERDVLLLIDLLEEHREGIFNELFNEKPRPLNKLSIKEEKEAIEFLSQPYLLQNINQALEEIGIIGESDNRLLLFIIATSYKSSFPLHAIIQSSSGSGKSHLMNTIAGLIPKQDVLSFSRVTSKAFYYYKSEDLTSKLILMQDLDGLNDEALYGLRELQSNGELTSSVTIKDKLGQARAKLKTVKGKFASISATTKEVYFDNYSRSIVLKIDESTEQTKRIADYQKRLLSGEISSKDQEAHAALLSNTIRVLQPYEVYNRYLQHIELPFKSSDLRRLNYQFQVFVHHVTLLHQYQRKIDKQGRLLAVKEDVKLGIELFFDSIYLKVDELPGGTRDFFEELKRAVTVGKIKNTFTQREVRQLFHLNKTRLFRYFKSLMELEYLSINSGTSHKGYKYQISYWDDYIKTKENIKQNLLKQLKNIK